MPYGIRLATSLLVAALLPATAFAQGADRDRTDLTVSNVVASASVVAGGSIDVEARLEAIGAPASFTWTAYLTIGGAIQGATALGTFGPVQLAAGARLDVRETIALPAGTTGRTRVAIVVDDGGVVSERNEYNNVALAADFTRIRDPKAALRVDGLSLSDATRRAGEALTIDYRVTNSGQRPATFPVAAYLSVNDVATTDDVEIARESITVEAGAVVTGQLQAQLPAVLAAGNYTVAVIADPDLAISEDIEFDNIAALPGALNVFADALAIATTSLPDGTVYIGYHEPIISTGGNGHYVYTLTNGVLPVGLELSSAGVLEGVPLQSGPFEVEVTVSSNGLRASATFSVAVVESGIDLTITTPSLGRGAVSLPYQAGLAVAGGEPPYKWTVSGGTLPPGMDLTSVGWMSGLPSQQGVFTVEIQVEDGLGDRDAQEFVLTIDAASVIISSGRLLPVLVGDELDIQLSVSGGKPPYEWQAKSRLPPGTSLSEDGRLVGAPTQVGEFKVRVEALDSSEAGASDTALVHLVVDARGEFEISTPSATQAGIYERVSLVLAATGGQAPLKWRVVPGDTLPQGFELNASTDNPERTAVVEGSSIRPMAHGFAVEVEDATGRRRQAVLSLRVTRNAFDAGSGCTCLVPRSDASASLLTAGLLLGLATLRRRRRRA